MKTGLYILTPILATMLGACATSVNPVEDMREIKPAGMLDAPSVNPAMTGNYSAEAVARGEYLVELLGCGSCHTDGALVGMPVSSHFLAGSGTGIAYSSPLKQKNPGVVYPSNLTPDRETGIGNWNDDALRQMIGVGIDPDGGHALPVMPWPAYAKLSDTDLDAIIAYLRNLPPVRHRVPDIVSPGNRAPAPFVYFGVYQSR